MARQVILILSLLLSCALASPSAEAAEQGCFPVKPGLTPDDDPKARDGEGYCLLIDGGATILMPVLVFQPRSKNTVGLRLSDALQLRDDGAGPMGPAVSSSFTHRGRTVVLLAPGGGYGNPFLFNYYQVSMKYQGSGVSSRMVSYEYVNLAANLGRLSFAGALGGQGWPAAKLQSLSASDYRAMLQAMLDGMAETAANGGDAAQAASSTSARMAATGRFEAEATAKAAAWTSANFLGLEKILQMDVSHPNWP